MTTDTTTVRVSIRAAYARLALTCAADIEADARYYLAGVMVEPRPQGGAYIIGTDGHTLMLIEDVDAVCTEPALLTPNFALADELPPVWRGTNADARRLVLLAREDRPPVLQLLDGQGGVAHTQEMNVCMPARREDGRPWYCWRKVMPDFPALSPGLVDPFHAPYVSRVLEAFAGSPQMVAAQACTETVIAFQFQGHPEVLLLVMPQKRGEWIEAERPGWLARWAAVREARHLALVKDAAEA